MNSSSNKGCVCVCVCVNVCVRACVIGTNYKNGICEGRHASNIFMFLFTSSAQGLYVHTIKYGPIYITHSYVSTVCCLLDTCLVCGNKNTKSIRDLQFLMCVQDILFPLRFLFNTSPTVVAACCALYLLHQIALHNDDTFR